MKVTYVSPAQPTVEYEIEADKFGSYTIRAAGKVVKRVTALATYIDKPRWGNDTLQRNAIDDAKKAIDALVAGGKG